MAENHAPRRMAHGPGGRMGTGEKAKDFKGTMKKLLNYIGKYKIGILFVLIFAVGGTVFNILGPRVLGNATDEIFNGIMSKISGGVGINFSNVTSILLTLLCMYIVSAVLSFAQGLVMTSITQRICYNMRLEISEKINRMPMKYFESRTYGEVLSRITNDVDTLGQSLNQSLTQLITAVTMLIGVFIMMLTISVPMTLLALLMIPLSLIIVMQVIKRSQKYFRAQQAYLGHVNGQVEEVFSGQNVVRVFNGEEEVIREFDQMNGQLYRSAWKSQFLSGAMMPLMQFVGNLGYVAVAIFGSYMTIRGSMTVGGIQSFIQYVRSFTQPIQQIGQVTNLLQSTAAAAERVFEFLNEAEEDQTAEHPVSIEGLQGNVTFDHVRFGYNPDKIVIHDFNAQVREGQ